VRILLLDTTAYWPASPLFLEALQELARQYPRDYQYAFVDEALFQRSRAALWRIARKLRQEPPLDLKAFNRFLFKRARAFRPHMLLICKGAYVFPETLLRIKNDTGAFLVNFATDDPFNGRVNSADLVASIPIYDVYACTKRAIMSDVRLAGCGKVIYLPFAYKPTVHFPEPAQTSQERQRFASDVVFVGGGDSDRAPLISALLNAIPDLNLALYGGKWNRSMHLRRHWRGIAFGREFRMALSCSKIALNLVRRANRDGHVMRTFEIPACRAFMLANRTDEHLDLLTEGEEAVYFDSDSDLIEQVSHYLDRDMARQAIADRGYKKITAGAHTYKHRLMSLIQTVASPDRDIDSKSLAGL
jgi:spore maturation protein CgeB